LIILNVFKVNETNIFIANLKIKFVQSNIFIYTTCLYLAQTFMLWNHSVTTLIWNISEKLK